MLVVGCAKLERRDAVVALVAHAAALLAATLDLTPGLTWKGVGPEQRENMHPWLRRWMSTVALFTLKHLARFMCITSGEPVPTERLATYDDTRQIFAD